MVTNLYIMSYNKKKKNKALNKILTLSVQHNHMVCYYELLHNKKYGPLKLFSQDVTLAWRPSHWTTSLSDDTSIE